MTKPTKRPPAAKKGDFGPASPAGDPALPQPEPLLTLSRALELAPPFERPSSASILELGRLPPSATPPEIPPELDAELNPRERRIAWLMINGTPYSGALRATYREDGTKRVQENLTKQVTEIPPQIVAAVSGYYRQVAATVGTSRVWIVAQTVALFEKASAAVPHLDRQGRPTGEFKFDGATSAKCLDMLAQWNGELYPRKAPGIAPGDVAQLLAAVASRGRPALEDVRGRVVESEGFAALRDERKTQDNQ